MIIVGDGYILDGLNGYELNRMWENVNILISFMNMDEILNGIVWVFG